LEIETIIKDLETLFEEKERILACTDPKLNIAKKYQNDQKIDENLNNMHSLISKFKQELESYKKKKKKVYFIKYVKSFLSLNLNNQQGDKAYDYYESISKLYDEHYERFRVIKLLFKIKFKFKHR